MKACCFSLILLSLLILPVAVNAGRPTEEVKATTDRVLAILRDPKLQGDTKKAERRQLLHKELDPWFDWTAIARGCLGRHWSKLTRAQQKEFAQLFSNFMEGTYLDKFEVYYTDLNKIEYTGEKIIDNYASIKLIVTALQVDHPVEYRMQKSPSVNHWQIYDVLIEGVSLIKNYRDQFDEIIARSSYEGLVKELKAKLPANQ